MFSTLFHYPRVLARHRNGPSANDRERYLAPAHKVVQPIQRCWVLHLSFWLFRGVSRSTRDD
jgi:hypothetical protein